jgi:hypothetical protein
MLHPRIVNISAITGTPGWFMRALSKPHLVLVREVYELRMFFPSFLGV